MSARLWDEALLPARLCRRASLLSAILAAFALHAERRAASASSNPSSVFEANELGSSRELARRLFRKSSFESYLCSKCSLIWEELLCAQASGNVQAGARGTERVALCCERSHVHLFSSHRVPMQAREVVYTMPLGFSAGAPQRLGGLTRLRDLGSVSNLLQSSQPFGVHTLSSRRRIEQDTRVKPFNADHSFGPARLPPLSKDPTMSPRECEVYWRSGLRSRELIPGL